MPNHKREDYSVASFPRGTKVRIPRYVPLAGAEGIVSRIITRKSRQVIFTNRSGGTIIHTHHLEIIEDN